MSFRLPLLLLLMVPALLRAAPETAPTTKPLTPEEKAKAEEKARKDGDLVKRQCRTVHLAYDMPKAKAAYMEITPEKSSPGTYFCALAFDLGYVGLQDLGNNKRMAVFSVWQPGEPSVLQGTPEPIPEDKRVTLVEKSENVDDGHFGPDGSGGQARLIIPWEPGKPVRFFVQAKVDGQQTEFTARIFEPGLGKWELLATFRSHSNGIPLQGLYSFIEDFRRNFESAKVIHRATYDNGWLLDTDGNWQPILTARFTADKTPSNNIDAGLVPTGFFLQTGGATENKGVKLWQKMTREAKGERPEELPGLLRP